MAELTEKVGFKVHALLNPTKNSETDRIEEALRAIGWVLTLRVNSSCEQERR